MVYGVFDRHAALAGHAYHRVSNFGQVDTNCPSGPPYHSDFHKAATSRHCPKPRGVPPNQGIALLTALPTLKSPSHPLLHAGLSFRQAAFPGALAINLKSQAGLVITVTCSADLVAQRSRGCQGIPLNAAPFRAQWETKAAW